MMMPYAPVRGRFMSTSEDTNRLLRRKRVLEFQGGKAQEWKELADNFLADGGKLNYAYCMAEYRKLAPEVQHE